jgi:GxxExxY protein
MRMQRFYRALRNPVEFDSCRQYPAPLFQGPKMVQPSDQPQSTQSTQSFSGLTERVIGAAIEVHRHLGPGLLESAYEACLTHELIQAGLAVQRQKPLPVLYKGLRLDIGYRLDLVIDDCLIVELKSVERLDRVHFAQMLSYLKLSGYGLGLVINFNVAQLKQGIRRIANTL